MDYLVNFIIWSLATFGAANIIVYSTIFLPVRNAVQNISVLNKLVNCILCMGFWVGLFWGLLVWSPASYFLLKQNLPLQPLFDAVFNGSVGSCVCWITYLMIADRMNGR